MISADDAREQILSSIATLGSEKVDILSALGRILAEDVFATRDLPPRDNSIMDGYALRAEDTFDASQNNPAVLDVAETIPAGRLPKHCIQRGQAARIMTGAPIPEGADSVIRIEDTQPQETAVQIFVPAKKGQYIRLAGQDVCAGDKVLTIGTEIRPAEIGLLAAQGRSFISVYRRPLVAILSTGDELIDIDQIPTDGKIVNNNSYALAAQVRQCGAVPVMIGIARDTRENLHEKLSTAARADLIVTSGGVSVGDFDLVKNIMQEKGNRMIFWQVAMCPGRPLAFGFIQEVPAIGLPGNPGSTMVSFEQFARPAILKMMGHRNLLRKTIQAVMREDFRKKPGMRYLVFVRLTEENGQIIASSTSEQGAGMLRAMVLADGLAELPEDISEVKKGDIVTVQLLC